MPKPIISKRYSLKLRDAVRGLIMGIGTPVLYCVQEMIPGMEGIHPVAKAAISATITYLIKNFFEGPKVILKARSNTNADYIKRKVDKPL